MKKTPKKVINKIAESDLKKLQEYLKILQKLKINLGDITIEKQNILMQYGKVESEFNQFSAGIEHKYGKISIDVATGEYTEEEKDGTDTKN